MRPVARLRAAAALFLGGLAGLAPLGLNACSRPAMELSPPEIYYGEDLCSECDMIISEARYAASIAYRQGGKVEYLLLDDMGEIFSIVVPDHTEVRYYVHDASTLDWIDATAAVYLQSAELRSPMGHGFTAFSARQDAEALASEYPGEILTYAEIVAR